MPLSHGELARPVAFGAVPNPGEWAPGDQPAYLVVTEKNWANYYSRLPTGSDFKTHIYLVASLGMKPNPGHTIGVREVKQLGEKISVKLELKRPNPRKVYPQVIVFPVAVAAVARAQLPQGKPLSFVFVDQRGKWLATVETKT